MLTKEIGIILIPDEETIEEANHLFNLTKQKLINAGVVDKNHNYPNTFHLSLYQLRIEEEKIPALYKALAEIKTDCELSFELAEELEDTKENVFWNVQKSAITQALKDLHTKVVNVGKEYFDKEHPFSQLPADQSTLPEEVKAAIKTYGVPWGLPHNFKPHITLFYNSGDDQRIEPIVRSIHPEPTTFRVKALAVGELGEAGNVVSIMHVVRQFEIYPQSTLGCN